MRVKTGICGIFLACCVGAGVAYFEYSGERAVSLEQYRDKMGYEHEDGVEALIPPDSLFPIEEGAFDNDGDGIVEERTVIAWVEKDYEFTYMLKYKEKSTQVDRLSLMIGPPPNSAVICLTDPDSDGNPQRASLTFPAARRKEGSYTVYYDQDSDGRLDMRSRFTDRERSSISVLYKNTWRTVLAKIDERFEIELDDGESLEVVFKDGEWKEAQE